MEAINEHYATQAAPSTPEGRAMPTTPPPSSPATRRHHFRHHHNRRLSLTPVRDFSLRILATLTPTKRFGRRAIARPLLNAAQPGFVIGFNHISDDPFSDSATGTAVQVPQSPVNTIDEPKDRKSIFSIPAVVRISVRATATAATPQTAGPIPLTDSVTPAPTHHKDHLKTN